MGNKKLSKEMRKYLSRGAARFLDDLYEVTGAEELAFHGFINEDHQISSLEKVLGVP